MTNFKNINTELSEFYGDIQTSLTSSNQNEILVEEELILNDIEQTHLEVSDAILVEDRDTNVIDDEEKSDRNQLSELDKFNLLLAEVAVDEEQAKQASSAFSGNTNNGVYTFGTDDRVLAGDTAWDQRIAFITVKKPNGGRSGFTGALISPFHILTVAHGIYDKDAGGFVDKNTIQVALGQDGTDRDYGVAKAVKYTYFTGYTDDANWQYSGGEWRPKSFGDDMAIITLDRNIGNHTGWFGYKYNNNDSYFQNLTVNTAGYPYDLADSWSWNDARPLL